MDPVLDAVLLGILGGAHCLGMCGAISAAVGASCRGRARAVFAGRTGAYLAGKTLGYAFLGAAAAVLGARILHAAELHAWRRGAVALAALTILLTGLRLGGWLPPLPRWLRRSAEPAFGGVAGFLRQGFAAARALPGAWGAAALGLCNAFLPCGLVLAAALLAATTSHALHGAAVMAAFGAATAPALLLPAVAGRSFARAPRAGLRRTAAALLLALAPLTLWRSGAWLAAPPPCCPAPDAVAGANE